MEQIVERMSAFIKAHVPWQPHLSSAAAPTVLIVDDEEQVRMFVEKVLRADGYATVTAAGGTEALEIVAKSPACDLLVTDLMMPHMRGDELAGHLRQSDPTLKVLYLTGFCDRLFMEKAVLWAEEAFLEKPASIGGLSEAVSLLLFGHTKGQGSHPPPCPAGGGQ